MNADGTNVTTIFTHNSALFSLPTWSPNGHAIAASQNFNLWRIDVAVVNGVPTGSNPTVILDRPTTLGASAWSPLGNQIAFVDVSQKTIETIPATGGVPTVRYTSTSPFTFVSYLAWSRDASEIAFTEGGAIRILNIATGMATTILGAEVWQQLGVDPPQFLDWARTQDVLTFSVGSESSIAVYTLQLPSGNPVFVVDGWVPTWSPDDQEILFDKGGLRKVNLATGQVTNLRASGQWPDWGRF
jgi:Tol biopolymer transport system component